MGTLASPADVRDIGRLPDGLSDDDIRPHLAGAGRHLASWIGVDYAARHSAASVAHDAAVEAECCICMAFLTPVLHVFYTEGAARVQRDVAESEFVFLSPADAAASADIWMDRARRAADAVMGIGSPAGSGGIKYAAV